CDTFGAAAEILFIPPDAHFIQEFAPTSVQGSIGSATSTFSYSLDARSDLASASMGVKSSMFGPANTAAQAESYLRDRIEVIGDFSANPKPAAIITIDAEGNWTGDAQYVGFEVYGHFGYPQPDGTFIWDSGLDLPALPSPFIPEPGTLLLVGVGLAGLGSAAASARANPALELTRFCSTCPFPERGTHWKDPRDSNQTH